jgi:phospho-N-acetylmuramoyl-pentapeptide-transferase
MILAALFSLAVVIFLGPATIRFLQRFSSGQAIRTADCALLGELHQAKQQTPTMGGLLILVAMLLSMVLWMDWTHIFTLLLLLTTLVLGAVGGFDDYLKLKYSNSKGLAGRKKLAAQLLVGAAIAFYMLYMPAADLLAEHSPYRPPIIKEHVEPSAPPSLESSPLRHRPLTLQEYAARFYLPFVQQPLFQLSGLLLPLAALMILFVIVAASNSVNLTDGLDGLAAGCLIMVSTCLALFAFVANNFDLSNHLHILYVEGSGEIAIYLSALVGACIGFLWYNGYPAQLFMGDTGSLALGGIVGVSAVLLKREGLLALVGGIFVVETLSVILQVASYRLRNKKRIFLCSPLHHHFECKGWPETKVVMRFWIIGLLLAVIGIASLKFQ